jgi:hypothetical protein
MYCYREVVESILLGTRTMRSTLLVSVFLVGGCQLDSAPVKTGDPPMRKLDAVSFASKLASPAAVAGSPYPKGVWEDEGMGVSFIIYSDGTAYFQDRNKDVNLEVRVELTLMGDGYVRVTKEGIPWGELFPANRDNTKLFFMKYVVGPNGEPYYLPVEEGGRGFLLTRMDVEA